MALFLPFSGHALTSQTTRNAIQGSAPYLTFDGGRTRAVDANGLLGITLSDGTRYTPSTNTSSYSRPIVLPVAGQSFADISMFVPTNTSSVDLSTLIGPPYNYWGDDDGDADVTATGSLSLSIVDKNNRPVSRDTVLTTCTDSAPYRIKLSSTNGTLSTRYGFPNRSTFSARSETYYVNPKAGPVVCFASPSMFYSDGPYAGPASMWDPANGFIPQSTAPSSYGRNFPTTGANNLEFFLLISGSSQPLSWSPVSHGGITATMYNFTATRFTRVRVILTGPYATESQHWSANPGRISKPTLPQTFELVGRDTNGTPVVKYGFTLKQWFVNRNTTRGYTYPDILSWCDSIGYRMPRVSDLTNASCPNNDSDCRGSVGATPSSPGNHFMRHIGSGFFAEWGSMQSYYSSGFKNGRYWADGSNGSGQFIVSTEPGSVYSDYGIFGLCSHP
ncbi:MULTISPECIES: hypothetical protein [unclassified Gilliamella]|uniref:hypothetical protein n=1 Tax=unclassified Gilliamella TaxID=2685620 RepID=UPI002269C233|nr:MULTISPECIES: hypothetical protein [unclassified Gilliamella]MCX8585598.1 hypothetical protein [Gilliamella sp. B3562]MCX8685509.1 hypothetical protein [Gilliamella sp. B2864]